MTLSYQLMMAFFLSFLTSVSLSFASTPVVDENSPLAKETNFSLQLINPHNGLSNQPREDLVSAAFWKVTFSYPDTGTESCG